MNPFIGSLIGAGVRWLITLAAARGVTVSDDQTTQIISGVAAVGMLLWSWYQKQHQAAKLTEAKGGW